MKRYDHKTLKAFSADGEHWVAAMWAPYFKCWYAFSSRSFEWRKLSRSIKSGDTALARARALFGL